MSLTSKFIAFCFSFALFFAFGTAATFADTIRLKDGSVIKGKVVDFKNQQFTVVLNGSNSSRRSQLTLYIDDVDSIEFDSGGNSTASTVSDADSVRETPSVVIRNENAGANNNNVGSNPNEAHSASANVANNNMVNTNSQPAGTTSAPNNPPSNSSASNSNNAPRSNTGGLSQVINSQPTASTNSRSNQTAARSNKFIPVNIKVLADNTANGWTNTGLVVKKGQRLRITATGRIALGSGKFATPAGLGSIADAERLMKTEPTGALIAVIGDDNNDFIFVGSNREFEASRDGTLFLGVNEGNLNDNSGAFDAVIEAEAIAGNTQQ